MRQLQLEQAKQVTKLRQEVEQGARDLASKADRRMKVRSGGLRPLSGRLLLQGEAFLLPSGASIPGPATPDVAHSGCAVQCVLKGVWEDAESRYEWGRFKLCVHNDGSVWALAECLVLLCRPCVRTQSCGANRTSMRWRSVRMHTSRIL